MCSNRYAEEILFSTEAPVVDYAALISNGLNQVEALHKNYLSSAACRSFEGSRPHNYYNNPPSIAWKVTNTDLVTLSFAFAAVVLRCYTEVLPDQIPGMG